MQLTRRYGKAAEKEELVKAKLLADQQAREGAGLEPLVPHILFPAQLESSTSIEADNLRAVCG